MVDTPKPPSVMEPEAMTLAAVYAQAVLESLPDDQAAEDLAAELDQLLTLMDRIEGFDDLLAASLLNHRQRVELIDRVFRGRVSETLDGLLGVLARHDRLGILRTVAWQYRQMLNKRQGKVEVRLTTAVELDASQTQAVQTALAEALGARPLLTARVDPAILGGSVLRVGDRVYDASVAAELYRMKKLLTERSAGQR